VSPTLSFPGAKAEWNSKNGVPRLQWRDRAGLSPDFPFKPLRAPKNWFKSYHAGAADVNESSLAVSRQNENVPFSSKVRMSPLRRGISECVLV
jgi:hypothetical protein